MKYKENRAKKERNPYMGIDMEKTGIHLKNMTEQEGYTVKDIQRYLHLACPQPVYRWFKGQVLPSVDHLYTLSKLLHVHMEELLLPAENLPSGDGEKILNCPDIYFSGDDYPAGNGSDGNGSAGNGNTGNGSTVTGSLLLNRAAGWKRRQLAVYWITMRKNPA